MVLFQPLQYAFIPKGTTYIDETWSRRVTSQDVRTKVLVDNKSIGDLSINTTRFLLLPENIYNEFVEKYVKIGKHPISPWAAQSKVLLSFIEEYHKKLSDLLEGDFSTVCWNGGRNWTFKKFVETEPEPASNIAPTRTKFQRMRKGTSWIFNEDYELYYYELNNGHQEKVLEWERNNPFPRYDSRFISMNYSSYVNAHLTWLQQRESFINRLKYTDPLYVKHTVKFKKGDVFTVSGKSIACGPYIDPPVNALPVNAFNASATNAQTLTRYRRPKNTHWVPTEVQGQKIYLPYSEIKDVVSLVSNVEQTTHVLWHKKKKSFYHSCQNVDECELNGEKFEYVVNTTLSLGTAKKFDSLQSAKNLLLIQEGYFDKHSIDRDYCFSSPKMFDFDPEWEVVKICKQTYEVLERIDIAPKIRAYLNYRDKVGFFRWNVERLVRNIPETEPDTRIILAATRGYSGEEIKYLDDFDFKEIRRDLNEILKIDPMFSYNDHAATFLLPNKNSFFKLKLSYKGDLELSAFSLGEVRKILKEME